MWSSTLGLCLLLTVFHGGEPSASGPQYMLLVPTVLNAGKEQTFCLQLSHLNESVDVTVSLEGKQNKTLLEKHVTEPEVDSCFTFQTPKVEVSDLAFITLDAVGDSLHFKSKRSVLIRNLKILAFMQTDKPIYKPGQKVQFRIATMDETFHSVHEKFPVIYVEDPHRNRIFQWVNLETNRGIAQESFLLTSEPKLGIYKMVAQREQHAQIEHSFSVEEYVLPKYEVQVKMAPMITILDEEVKVTVCGRYTYGKPVAGRIDVQVCRKFSYAYSSCPDKSQDGVCEELSHEADNNGCFSEVVKTKLFQLRRHGYENKVTAKAKITEEGTGVELTGEASSQITNTITKVSFQQLDSRFKRGIPLYGQVFLEDAAGKPISNETVKLYVGSDGTNFTYTTGPDGKADFSIETTKLSQHSITLRVTHKPSSQQCYSQSSMFPIYVEDSRTINHFYSRSRSYLKIQPIYHTLKCEEHENIIVHYTLTPEGVKNMSNVVFHHLIMSKGKIIDSGNHEVELNAKQESRGQFTFKLPVNVNTAPLAKVLVYLTLDSSEVIADSVSFKVEKCFENKAKILFTDDKVLPGANTNLVLSSLPNSLCALRAVDSSVLLLKPEAELSAKTVYDLLQVTDLSGYHHEGFYLEETRDDPCLQVEPIFLNGVYYNPSVPTWDTDTYKILKDLGLKVATNTIIRIPVLCDNRGGYGYAGYARGITYNLAEPQVALMMENEAVGFSMSSQPRRTEDSEIVETVRKFFPETWLWDLVEIDNVGQAVMKLTAPDSITTWNVGMFCTSEEVGFGLAEPVTLVTFQPFFLDLTLPYSAVRGEKFTLKVSVFNYMTQTIRVVITLEKSDKFTANTINTEDEGHCIKANGRVTVEYEVNLQSLGEVNFTVSAQTLPGGGLCGNEIVNPAQGRKDTITKHILVEPEGIEKEETHSAMICGKGDELTDAISLKLPSQVVEGSQRAYFSVIGDIMGTAMQNLGNLLKMPSGCGEQNIALFTPNIFILEYLNNTGQLTPQIKSKALNYLYTGYQRQLIYRHYDGSYSAFGPRFGEGNTWLTAFVLKSFSKAQSHIYIEPKQISHTLEWLLHKQKPNGCFYNAGQLFNNALKGGVNNEVALAAYITITLLEIKLPVTHLVVNGALLCLEKALDSEMDIYTEAIMAYAFSLAGKVDIRSRLLHDLDGKAIKQDGTIHWHRPKSSEDSAVVRDYYHRAPSLEVEMTSYVMLAMLTKPNLNDEDMTHASKVVSWIIKQQNPTGGFSSTQDTVVALQALATYGYIAHRHDSPREVAVTLGEAPVAKLQVEDSNRLLLQQVPLPDIPGDYTVSVNGPGCVFVQSTLKYNIPPPEGEAPFTITVTTVPETCSPTSIKSFAISANVSYIGSRVNSNMAIVEINLPSGYIPVKSSVKQLSNHRNIQKAESHPNKVIVYFEQLTNNSKTFTFQTEQDIPVSNLQPASARIYDYYEPGDFAVTKYRAPCSSKDDIQYA
ncbi:alpha-2-macroglobulin-like [Mantella aurantiaca]